KDLEDKITDYFTEGEEKKKLPTKGGLALHLGTTRETLGDYEGKGDEFSYAIKRAYGVIEEAWVQRLNASQQVAGTIFYLKNAFHFRDRTETDVTSGGEKIIGINYVIPDKPND
ncbi:MAG: hypothetical protein IIA48_10485, partial [Bacteroidetes bacterium]|nr:hypothetical protein [Bacteroidota bacterium]